MSTSARGGGLVVVVDTGRVGRAQEERKPVCMEWALGIEDKQDKGGYGLAWVSLPSVNGLL